MVALFDSMNNPKIYISALLASMAFLYLLLQYMPDQRNGFEYRGKVISNTLTQSLDGHRRYLTVYLIQDQLDIQQGAAEVKHIYRVSVPPTEDCPAGSTAIISTQSISVDEASHFRLVKCFETAITTDTKG
ncbi:hypothetical protein [Vibrio mexicanus]|uniref:hypothetical protein n=1 Tax=Vibrio mexicanus TaxID=1004326 RepID=UPI00069A6D5C